MVVVRSRAPLDPAIDAALADAGLPDDCAFVVRVEPVDDARLLAHRQQALPVSQIHEVRRGAEIEVGSIVLRAIGVTARTWLAAPVPDIAAGDLPNPAYLSRLHVKRHDGVRRFRDRQRIGVAGCHIDGTELRIERRRRPDADT